jgi:hypothetical protein
VLATIAYSQLAFERLPGVHAEAFSREGIALEILGRWRAGEVSRALWRFSQQR